MTTFPTHTGNRKRSQSIAARITNGFAGAKLAAYNRAMRDNTIAMSVSEGTDYAPTYTAGDKHLVTFNTVEVAGRMYHTDTPYFHPQTKGQHHIDVIITGEIPISAENLPSYADNVAMTRITAWLVKKAVDNTVTYFELASNYGQRYWDSRIPGWNTSVLHSFSIASGCVVDHTPGTSYALAIQHNGAQSITTMTYFRAYMAIHYYGTALTHVATFTEESA
jgi:hypothetical protein